MKHAVAHIATVGTQGPNQPLRLMRFADQVFHGNPSDMLMQGIIAMLAACVNVWVKVNPFVGVYVAMVVVDTILGVRLNKRIGRPFLWRRLLYGPGEKIVFTTLILIAAEFMQGYLPLFGTTGYLTQAIGAYMSMVLFLEALGKYDQLTGNHVLAMVRDRIGSLFGQKTKTPTRRKPM